MNKAALKNFATNARNYLLKKIEAKALKIGITEENIKNAQIESSDAIYIEGKQLSIEEKKQRDKLIQRIEEIGFQRVVEEVAYTWFNRFTALRFMEVNNYLPTKIRVLSSSDSESLEPDLIKEALTIDLDVDKELIYELKLNNKTEELYKYLIIKQCNDLNRFLPFMFETIDDYKEILFPEGLLAKDSFLRELTDLTVIPESDWEHVEIIGWLYQYYIAEEKDRVIKAKKKYKSEEIPFATQLFTPDWIVRYLVQNSLGRYWVEVHPDQKDLIQNWEYYLESRSEDPDFAAKLAPYIEKNLQVEEIKCLDPAMGSGHILLYLFDVLYEIYSKCGYMEREIPRLIIEKNLYGFDIDDRAYQLACFSMVMKALQYNSRFLRSIEREGLVLNLVSIQETNHVTERDICLVAGAESGPVYEKTKQFIEQFKNAKTYGSLLPIDVMDQAFFAQRAKELQENPVDDLFEEESRSKMARLLPELIKQTECMQSTYDILITNPPYMGSRYMNTELASFLKGKYEYNSDLFSVFMEYSLKKVKANGQLGFITPFVWMFLSSYEDIRKKIVAEKSISSLVQLEYNAFEAAVVPVCTFTLRNYAVDLPGEFIRLSDFTGVENQPRKTLEAIQNPQVDYRYTRENRFYKDIPGQPVAYWISDQLEQVFGKQRKLIEYIDVTGSQNITADNERFLRKIWEVEKDSINKRWSVYFKGGNYRKWYGNIEYVVDWSEQARDFYKTNKTSNLLHERYWFRNGLTYNGISNRGFSVRLARFGIYDKKGPTFHLLDETLETYMIGLLNSKVTDFIMNLFNPTMSYQMKDVNNIPVIIAEDPEVFRTVEELAEQCIHLSMEDWNANETSIDFQRHPLLSEKGTQGSIEKAYLSWKHRTEERFAKLRQCEERLNEIFIDLYGLQGEMSPAVEEEDVTVSQSDRERDIKSFLSYAVGCMFGRYSLDQEGLVFAGGHFDAEKYQTFAADQDNILPIVSGDYLEEDLVSKFIEFMQVTFGEDKLPENLQFVAQSLGMKNGETPKETIRRYFLHDFFKDHVQTYKKRPVYWLFTSGKQKAFHCLIYMHRYDKTTLSRIRTDYLHELQMHLDTEKKSLLGIIEGNGTAKEISSAKKVLKTLDLKIEELKAYDEQLHHMADRQIEIDLNDGVAANYGQFSGLLAKLE